jgi:hypothetical protein
MALQLLLVVVVLVVPVEVVPVEVVPVDVVVVAVVPVLVVDAVLESVVPALHAIKETGAIAPNDIMRNKRRRSGMARNSTSKS